MNHVFNDQKHRIHHNKNKNSQQETNNKTETGGQAISSKSALIF